MQWTFYPLYLTGDRNTPFTTFPSENYAGKIFGTECNGGLLNKKIRICFINWLIDYIWFYAVSAIFQPFNGGISSACTNVNPSKGKWI